MTPIQNLNTSWKREMSDREFKKILQDMQSHFANCTKPINPPSPKQRQSVAPMSEKERPSFNFEDWVMIPENEAGLPL